MGPMGAFIHSSNSASMPSPWIFTASRIASSQPARGPAGDSMMIRFVRTVTRMSGPSLQRRIHALGTRTTPLGPLTSLALIVSS